MGGSVFFQHYQEKCYKIRIAENWETVNWKTVIWEKGKLGNRKFRKLKMRKPDILKTVNWEIVNILIRNNSNASRRRPVLSIVHFVLRYRRVCICGCASA